MLGSDSEVVEVRVILMFRNDVDPKQQQPSAAVRQQRLHAHQWGALAFFRADAHRWK